MKRCWHLQSRFCKDQRSLGKTADAGGPEAQVPAIRAGVVPALRSLCTREEIADCLVRLLHDPSRRVVRAALLEAKGMNQAIPPGEITRLLQDGDPEIRRTAAYALDGCRNPAVIDPLLEATQDAIASVQAQALVSLSSIGAAKAYDRFMERLAMTMPKFATKRSTVLAAWRICGPFRISTSCSKKRRTVIHGEWLNARSASCSSSIRLAAVSRRVACSR